MTTTDSEATILTLDRLDIGLLDFLAKRYMVIVERKDGQIVYELHNKKRYV